MTETKYVWIADSGKNMCEECAALNGTEYTSLADVPEKPHPNCNCTVEEISGLVRKRLNPHPWTGKNAPKNIYGNPIYIAPDGTRKVQPSPLPFFSKDAVQARQWKMLTEKEREKKDEKLIREVHKEIKEFEGEDIEHGYADTKGFVTFGQGKIIPSRDKIKDIILYKPDRKNIANEEEKLQEYDRIIKTLKSFGENGNKDKPYNYLAKEYQRGNSLLFLNGEQEALKHLKDNLNTIRSKDKFPEFDSYPVNAQKVIIDMEYNMGRGFHDGTPKHVKETNKPGYPNFFKAIRKGDWRWAAKECTSPQIGKDRNEWRKKMLNTIY